MRQRILKAYNKPGHPIAFSAPASVAEYFNVSLKFAKEVLEHDDAYNLHREYKQPKVYNPYYSHSRREQVQADLIDVSKIANNNDGCRFLLVLIDIFTKRVWVYPLKSKSGKDMLHAMRTWVESLRQPPSKLVTDRGLEFTNRRLQELLRRHNIEWYAAGGTMKAAIAERVNKTLQILIYKYMTAKETTRYIDKLPSIVATYNKRPHRTLKGLPPKLADLPRNEGLVQSIHHLRYEKIARHRKTELPYKVGDLVRIKTEAKKISSSTRAYAEQFHGEYFRIIRINRTMPIAMYYLRSLDTGEMIQGGFYANELQRQRGDVYKIERVLGRRTRRGVREVHVKWKYFGDQWNEWIPETEIVEVY